MSLSAGTYMTVDTLDVGIYPDEAATAAAAARVAARAIGDALADRGRARVIFGAAPSQDAMISTLLADSSIDWSRVTAFQMDEYIGLPEAHPRNFGVWLAERFNRRPELRVERLRPGNDPLTAAADYARLLMAEPIDLTCLGIGMNGHIAFNDPGSAFDDLEPIRIVDLDVESRQQQVTEGLFATLDQVPAQAVTVTIPALLRGNTLVTTVLGAHKAQAVADALTGPVGVGCPASVLRTRPRASLHLDLDAAAKFHNTAAAPQP